MRARLFAIATLVGCSHPAPQQPPTTPPSTTPPVAGQTPQPPQLRLPADVAKPTHEEVDLVIDPASEDFSGAITTELDVLKPTKVLWLNADEITVDKATIKVGNDEIAATPIPVQKSYLGFSFAKEIPAGKATLSIRYRGKSHHNDGDGIYTLKEGDDWYAFTQFEMTDARQAFPCFDEPGYKIPWRVTIHTKKPLIALSNTLVESETDEPNGMKKVVFGETKPLPSYLIAFAVGPFEAVDAGKSRTGVPIRIVVPKGRTGDIDYPVKNTKRILDALEDYFGIPYPYPKLDMLAVPIFTYGAMENPGLITYHRDIVIIKPEDMTRARKETYTTVAAHEMAHQWFGDMVTMAWWDDAWLNESFASWMEAKITDKLEPTWDGAVKAVGIKSGVMGQDSLDTARQIRQPINTANDILNAFDGITYQKGESVLTMIERHMTPEVFQKGVRAYLAKHMWGNTTYTDFVQAMTEASGTDQKPLFDSFVMQSGVPMVTAKLDCTKGAQPKLSVSQRRYKPTGSEIDPKRTWSIPMCVKWSTGNKTGRDCAMLAAETGEVPLSAKTCPEYVLPNDGELGYYRTLPEGKLLDQLLAHVKQLTLAERVGLVGDIEGLVNSGDVTPNVALQLVADLSKDKSRHMVDASIGIVAGIDNLVSDQYRPNYERFIAKMFAPRAKELGWASKPREEDNVKLLRPQLLAIVATHGRDKELIAKANEMAWKWIADHKAVQPELVEVTLHTATRNGDQKLFDKLHELAKTSKDREEKGRILTALGSFQDPKILEQAMGLALTDEFELRDALGLLFVGLQDRKTRDTAFAFIKTHFDDIAKKMPAPFRQYLSFTFVQLCDKAKKPEIEAFYKARVDKFDGGPRLYEQAMEELELCDAKKKSNTPGIEQFLKTQ